MRGALGELPRSPKATNTVQDLVNWPQRSEGLGLTLARPSPKSRQGRMHREPLLLELGRSPPHGALHLGQSEWLGLGGLLPSGSPRASTAPPPASGPGAGAERLGGGQGAGPGGY
jgi:hypothetical protein